MRAADAGGQIRDTFMRKTTDSAADLLQQRAMNARTPSPPGAGRRAAPPDTPSIYIVLRALRTRPLPVAVETLNIDTHFYCFLLNIFASRAYPHVTLPSCASRQVAAAAPGGPPCGRGGGGGRRGWPVAGLGGVSCVGSVLRGRLCGRVVWGE